MNSIIKVGIYRDDAGPWPFIREALLPKGIEIELIHFSSYPVLNMALSSGAIDLNCFQHEAYLRQENEDHGYDLVPLCKTYLEPMALYSNTRLTARDLRDGDEIVIPADPSNARRAFKVLNDAGILTTDPKKGYLPEEDDILENPLNLKFTRVDSESTIYSLEDPSVAGVMVMANIAFEAGLHVDRDAVARGSKDIVEKQNPFFIVIVTRNTDKYRPEFKEIIKEYRSDEVNAILRDMQGGQLLLASDIID